MTEADDRDGPPAPAVGSYHLESWRPDGTAGLTAAGADPSEILLVGLRGVLAAARGDAAGRNAGGTTAVPIRGQGSDLGRVFAELAADLLAQLDANGLGLDEVRLDGLLKTDDGGYTAWGYLLGVTVANPPPLGLAVDGDPLLTRTANALTLHCRLTKD